MVRKHFEFLIIIFIVISSLSVYWQVKDHEFVDYDDYMYVTRNHHVQAGFTRENLLWAFTTVSGSNWHPITWLSYMLDYKIYGLNPKGYLLTNLLFHIANSLFLFLILKRITGALWQSAFVSSLFALHPLHVESVAWVAERKDVLSAFFWMLTMWTYIRYVERPEVKRYLLILLAFALGLMSKPMLVTLPFVLFLLDYWPLNRLKFAGLKNIKSLSKEVKLIREKIPFFILAVASSVITYLAQHKGGAVSSFELIPLWVRIGNSFVAYVSYIWKTIWPRGLAVFYPHPGNSLLIWQGVGASLIILCLFLLAIFALQTKPYISFGLFWYLGTLVPVIGLVQIGAQSMADRYMYIPLIGLSVIIAWGVPDLMAKWRYRRIGLSISAGGLISAFLICTYFQVQHWRNSITLFERAVKSTSSNYVAHNRLGVALSNQGKIQEALYHYSKAIQIKPNYATAHYDMAIDLASLGRLSEAVKHFKETIRFNPNHRAAYNNLGIIMARQGDYSHAIAYFSKALQINPYSPDIHNNLGLAFAKHGKLDDAIKHYLKALRLKRDFPEAQSNLKKILIQKGQTEKEITQILKTWGMNP